MSEYDQFTQGQETEAQNKYDFWANAFSHFNPQATQYTPANGSPFYQSATTQALAGMPQANASGSFNANKIGQRIGMANNERANNFNQGQREQAFEYNPSEAMKYGLAGLGRENQFSNLNEKMNKLPVDRFADFLALGDTEKSAIDAYKASQGDWFNNLIGRLGSIGGILAGKALGKKAGSSGSDYGLKGNDAQVWDALGSDQTQLGPNFTFEPTGQ